MRGRCPCIDGNNNPGAYAAHRDYPFSVLRKDAGRVAITGIDNLLAQMGPPDVVTIEEPSSQEDTDLTVALVWRLARLLRVRVRRPATNL